MKLTVCDLTKYFDKQLVFKNINLEMDEGQIYGIKGDNGTGKSTLFRIIAGLEKPTSGYIRYNGSDFDKRIRKKITYMHQKPYMMKRTVMDNILYPLRIRGKVKEEHLERCHEIMEELDLYKFRDKKAWMLSGGEMQKVSLARALIFQPELLLMDEPTAHIDKKTVTIIENMIIKRQENHGLTTAIVTHDTPSMDKLFNQVYYL